MVKTHYFLKNNSKLIKGQNNTVEHSEALLSKVTINVIGENNIILIKKGAKVSNLNIFMSGRNHKLVVGENCIIKSGSIWFEDDNCEINIGDSTTIENARIAATEPNSEIVLGKDCMLSSAIDIITGDSHSIIDLETNTRINHAKSVYIGDHVWIGAGVKVLKGVTIGNNGIIGTESVVTKEVPANTITVGIPAKVIKTNVTWDRNRIYD